MKWKYYKRMNDSQKDYWNYHFRDRPSFNLRISQLIELEVIYIFTLLAYIVAIEQNNSAYINIYFIFADLTKLMFLMWGGLYAYDLFRIYWHRRKQNKWLIEERLK